MMQKIVLATKAFGQSLFLIIGEFYDGFNESLIKNLRHLTPFKCQIKNRIITPFITEDLEIIRDIYKLTRKYRLIPPEISVDTVTFHTPTVYHLSGTNLTPFGYYSSYIRCNIAKDKIGVVLPIGNPIERGEICEQLIECCPRTILVSGEKKGNNRDSTAILAFRCLRKKGFPKNRIIKHVFGSDIKDILEILDIACGKKDIIIACDYDTMIGMRGSIKDRKISYICAPKVSSDFR